MNPPYLDFRPQIRFENPELGRLLIQIEAHRLAIMRIPLPPTLQQQINQLNILRAIRGTTGLEGNRLNESQIEKIVDKGKSKSTEEQEVLNASLVYEHIKRLVKSGASSIVTEELIKSLHTLTTQKCDYPENIPGEYRTSNVTAGEFRPPTYEDVSTLMKQFVLFINSRQVMETYSPVIRAVLAHFYVVTIHPFRDGNGRTSRAVEAFILFQAGYNVRGFYSLANFYYRNRAAYIRMLQEARFKHHGDMNEYVLFSLRGFLAELETVKEETTSFLRSVLFKNYVQELLSTSKLIKTNSTRKRLISFVLWLIDQHPDGIEIKTVKERADGFIAGLYRGVASVRTIERDLMLLLKCRLLRSQDGKLFPNLALMQEYES